MNPITLPVAELRPALAGFSKVLPKRSTLPVLGCVQVQGHATGLVELTVTDLNHSATCTLNAKDKAEPVTLLVPFEDLNNVTKSCGASGQITVAINHKRSTTIRFPVGGQTVEHHCETVPPQQFPAMPDIKGESVVLDDSVRESIHQALERSSTDTTRAVLQGAFLDVSKPGAHYVVGTDGKHLFSSNSFALPLAKSVIIPEHKFLGWKGFNQDGEWKLRGMAATKNTVPHCELSTDHRRFVSRCADAQYPDWKVAIPESSSFKTRVTIDPDELEQVTISAQRLPIHEERHQTVGIEVSGGKLSLLAKQRADQRWTKIAIEEARCTGSDLVIQLDKRILVKALRFGLNYIEFIDGISPLKFSHAGRTMIVMPLRANPTPTTPAPPPRPPAVPAAAAASANSTNNTPPSADQPQPTQTMSSTNGHSHNAGASSSGITATTTSTASSKDETKSALETALGQIEGIKAAFRESIAGLTKLGDTIRLALREQKSGDKDLQSVRQTLRTLQNVRI